MKAKLENPSDTAIKTWAQLLRVSRHLLSAVEQDLKDAKQPPLAWYDALLELKRAGPDGLRPFQLQSKMLLAQYNLSRLVDRLVAEGLVKRVESTTDGRGFVLHLTPEGRKKQAMMWKVYQRSIADNFAGKLSERDMLKLSSHLGQFGT
ncbi:MAG: MarR family transcriptional regulator [Hyphomicrobiales bacterium]|nr:MarR family transcriptional regulator [Hyphomicrobiales bacterium]